MKKLFLTIILAAIALAGMSQNIGEAFYIYRNDGQFNAFFRDEVQSIEYSYEDADGVVYDEIVTQIVTTADSVYKIPLAAIDSIGFVQPETIYAENVKVIDNLMPYIKGVDGMVLTLSSEIPKDITPNINDVLLYENFDNSLFPFGFAGKVTSINNNTITCDEVTIDDIYQKLIGIGSMETLDDGQSVALRIHSRRVSGGTTASVKLSLPYGSEEEGFYGKLEGLLSFGIHVIYQHERGKSDYINVNLSPHIGIALEAGIKGKLIDWKWASKEIDLFYVPIPSTPFLLMITGTPVISASLEASITARRELSWGCDLGFSYENGKWSKFFKNKVGDPRDLELQGNVKGRFFIGPKIGFGVYSVGKVLATSIKNEIGAEFVADNGTDFLNTDNYEELSKKQVDCNLTGKFSLDAELKFAKVIKLEKEWEIASFTKNLNSWKLFPTFSTPTLDGSNSNNITVSTVPSEKLLWPVSIGLSLWKDNSLQDISYCTENYRTIESWPLQKYQTSFYNIKPNTEYIVSPLVKINGVEFRATPDATVYIKKDIPISIISFNINEATYSLNGYEHEGSHYTFRYIAETSVRLNNTENVEEWGYVYEDPDHEIKHISLKGKESPYTDTNYAFYRNEPIATATLYGYVKYIGDDNYYYGEKKDYDLIYDKQPKAETLDPTEVDETSAKVKCAYHEAAPWGGTCGIEYWEDTNVKDAKRIYFETASDEIEIPINLLKPNTVYYYQALIKVDKKYVGLAGIEKEDVYSDEIKTFTTKPHVVISSSDAINVKTTSATLTGTVEGYDPADESIKFAFMYSNESDLANSSNGVTVPAQYDGNGNLTAEISGLSDYTTYYYALAIKRGDAAYETSEVKSFKTLPVVTTLNNATSTSNSATLYGTCSKGISIAGFSVKKDGDTEYTQYGAVPDEDGNFSATVDGLESSTTYHYYAFIRDGEQSYLGEEYSFTTKERLVAITLGLDEIDDTKAYVKCNYIKPQDEYVWCGVEYWDETMEQPIMKERYFFNTEEEAIVLISNLKPKTKYYYRALISDGNEYIRADETRSFTTLNPLCPDDNHPHMIDLGLPSGTKWACCNVGADNPEGFGGYYAWGETEEKSRYDTNNYLLTYIDEKGGIWRDPDTGNYFSIIDIGSDIAGTEYDVATVKWGSGWTMPSRQQIMELREYCEAAWGRGRRTMKFIGSNGNFIILPDAGNKTSSGTVTSFNGMGFYWSSSASLDDETYHQWAFILRFDHRPQIDKINMDSDRYNRSMGFSVRPVHK